MSDPGPASCCAEPTPGWAHERPPWAWQLHEPAHVIDLRPDRAPAVARSGPPSPAVSRSPAPPSAASRLAAEPAIFLLTRAADAEVTALTSLLRQAGVGCLRLDADDALSCDLLAEPRTGLVRIGPRLIAPTVTWVRHFSADAIGGAGRDIRQIFAGQSWEALAGQLAAMSPSCLPDRCPGPLRQLALAARLGIPIPRTVAVTEPRLALELIKSPRVVVKSAGPHFAEAVPGLLTGAFADPVPASSLRLGAPEPTAPVLVQEFVPHRAELRVYYVRGQVLGFEVRKRFPAAPWVEPDRVAVRPVPLPEQVAKATTQIATALRLPFGAFDFLLGPSGPVFLEANPDGDWRWAEERAETTMVTTAVAAMLADLHRRHLDGPEPFDLLGFLAGPIRRP